MPGSLEKISDDELAPGDVRKRRATIRKLAAMYNAFLDFQIVRTSGKDALTLSDNATLELKDDPAAAAAASSRPTPFQLLQTAAGTNSFLLNQNSYLREYFNLSNSTPITGSTTPLTLSDGDSVWLQLDTSGSSGQFDEASIASGQSAPYESNGGKLMTFSGGGTGPDDPFVWDESYTPLAQVFAADASGESVRGGIVYTVAAASPPTRIEIVQLTWTHLAMRTVVSGGQVGMMALPDAGPLIS